MKSNGSPRKGFVRKGHQSPRKPLTVSVPASNAPLALGPNVPVNFSLKDFVHRLFVQTLGVGAFYKGPGPLEIKGGFEYLDEITDPSSDGRARNLFAIRYLAQEIMSKFDDGSPDPQKMKTAMDRFLLAEHRCAIANSRFAWDGVNFPIWANPRKRTPYMCPETGEMFSLDCLRAVRYARDYLSRIVKYNPDLIRDHVYFAGHGPGASTRHTRKDATQAGKWSGSLHITEGAMDFAREFLELNPGYQAAGGSFSIFPVNILATVPKNWKTYRMIAKEADGNMLYQKCIAVAIRRVLLDEGIDLSDQSRNRSLAASGVARGNATWDGSMASDTVAINPVSFLFPRPLYDHLMKARAPTGVMLEKGTTPLYIHDGKGGFKLQNGTEFFYQKLSSMGNGATFEVETLLFLGLAKACCHVTGCSDTDVSVYGDDVVIPCEAYPLFREVVNFCGFVTNDEKSFSEGPFRESCGGHYLGDTDVTPFYVREEVNYLDRLFLLHNNTWRWFNRNPGICEPGQVRVLLAWIRSHAPEEWRKPRLFNPDVGDGAFIGKPHEGYVPKQFWDYPRELAPTRRFSGWDGYGTNVLMYRTKGPDVVLDADRSYDDAKAIFAGIWNGTFYESRPADRLGHLADPIRGSNADLPWKSRYWEVGIQVYDPPIP